MPGLRDATLLAHVAALRPVTAGDVPVAAPVPAWSNLLLANGGGAKGMLLCAGIARQIGALLARCLDWPALCRAA